jgi:uncharacterized protein (TIGR02246 family)
MAHDQDRDQDREQDRQQIKALIERWAQAVHEGDMSGVLADHADDVVMYDVPPPQEGVRGIDAYRQTWPQFFQWQAQGASFEITSLEITASEDVAFAYALVRCGTPDHLERHPEQRLRLTIGLRKEAGRWLVTHEHHSFADSSETDNAAGEQEVRDLHENWFARTRAKDLNGLMEPITDNVVSYEHDAPLRYVGIDAVRKVCKQGLDAASGSVSWDVPDLEVLVRGELAVAWGLNRMRVEQADGTLIESWSRGTRIFQKSDGTWSLIHQHLSYPYDPTTSQGRTDLRP